MASRLVQYGVSASPSTGGTDGRVPVPSTMPWRAWKTWSPTRTRPGPSSRPLPRTKRPPLSVNRCTATRSSQSSVASARIRFATGAQSGVTWAVPPRPSTRRASAIAFAARIIILLGTHPQ